MRILGILGKIRKNVVKLTFSNLTAPYENTAPYAYLVSYANSGNSASSAGGRLNLMGGPYNYVEHTSTKLKSYLNYDFDLTFELTVIANASGRIITFDDNGSSDANLLLNFAAGSGLYFQSKSGLFGLTKSSAYVPISLNVSYLCKIEYRDNILSFFLNGNFVLAHSLVLPLHVTSQYNFRLGGFGATSSIYGYLDNVDLTLLNKTWEDPAYTLTLLHMEAANLSTGPLTDSSVYGNQFIIGPGSSYVSTNWSKFGTSSYYSPARNIITYAGGAGMKRIGGINGTGDWQIDLWIKPTDVSSQSGVFAINGASNEKNCLALYIDNGILKLRVNTTLTTPDWAISVNHQTTLVANAEYHIRFLRKHGFIRLFLNGIEATTSVNIGNTPIFYSNIGSEYPSIGSAYISHTRIGFMTGYLGYIDEVRIRQRAVYEGNFTPPTTAFTY